MQESIGSVAGPGHSAAFDLAQSLAPSRDSPMALKILCVGDMHLGRRPSRLPAALSDRAGELGPAGGWRRVVELALAQQVDAVALAGDVIEREDDFYEAYRELHAGTTRLTDAGIRVLGVAGNHDVQVLPRLAAHVPGFHLLGRDGKWEPITIEAGSERLTIWGWSFPQRHVLRSPLEGIRFDRRAGTNLGLLHCDRDQSGSRYAPVMSRELDAAGLDGWLLGHVHVPDELSAPSPRGYLGSVSGLDPGEPGARGPWLLSVERGRIREIVQQVIAPLRWERLELDLTTIERPEMAHDRLLERLRLLDQALASLSCPPEAVGLRVQLSGRTSFGDAVEADFSEDIRGTIPVGGSQIHYFIERLRSATRPEIPVESLAGRADPLGLLARRLLWLEGPPDDPDRQALITAARRRFDVRANDNRWQLLGACELDDEAVAGLLHRAATRLLEQMLAQRGSAA
jgi:DNA repair protein SbcD/Mre11